MKGLAGVDRGGFPGYLFFGNRQPQTDFPSVLEARALLLADTDASAFQRGLNFRIAPQFPKVLVRK